MVRAKCATRLNQVQVPSEGSGGWTGTRYSIEQESIKLQPKRDGRMHGRDYLEALPVYGGCGVSRLRIYTAACKGTIRNSNVCVTCVDVDTIRTPDMLEEWNNDNTPCRPNAPRIFQLLKVL